MPDRFTRGILEGSIGSVEQLKAAYKSAAKRAHPDLSDGAGHEDFLRLRTEYERALRELSRAEPAAAASEGTAPPAPGDPCAALDAFLKRGFPKTPRHRKEILRYRYARLRALSALAALDGRLPELFEAMERELSGGGNRRAAAAVAGLLAAYVRAKRGAVPAALAAVRMETLRAFPPAALSPEAAPAAERRRETPDESPGPAAAAFFRALPY